MVWFRKPASALRGGEATNNHRGNDHTFLQAFQPTYKSSQVMTKAHLKRIAMIEVTGTDNKAKDVVKET
jgi:hypothetical protein